MDNLGEGQQNTSNSDMNWAKLYDFYEVEMREKYKTVSKYQNDSHFEMLKSKAADYLKSPHVFCEIGFSAGLTLRHAMPYFEKVVGLDISPGNVEFTTRELMEEGYSNFALYTSDLMKYDNRFCNEFDVISIIHGLEHFSKEDYPVILENIKKYLKPGGIFTGALPNKNSFNFRMCPHCNKIFEIDGHVSSHDLKSLGNVFNDNGFKSLHLDNFNLRYAMKHGNFLKKIYSYLYYYLLNNRGGNQIEFIVTPISE